MPRRVFKPLSRQRHRWKDRWFMRPFRLLLEHPVYWTLNRRNVTRAFAMGLMISFVPIPVHFLLATLVALTLRLNVPAAIFGTFLANPLTMVPMYMAAYWVGCHLLGISGHEIAFQMTWDWLRTALLPIWKPFLLGCVVLGASAAICGYIVLGGIWHLSLVLKYHERKGATNAKASAKAEK
ncbi:MAG: DUF2062 domain-containing protein [Steroidobacter sp.]